MASFLASPSPLRACRNVRAAAAIRPHYTPSLRLVWRWQVVELKASAILAVTGVVSECRGSSKNKYRREKKHGADGGRQYLCGVKTFWRHQYCTRFMNKEQMRLFIPHWTSLPGTTSYAAKRVIFFGKKEEWSWCDGDCSPSRSEGRRRRRRVGEDGGKEVKRQGTQWGGWVWATCTKLRLS